MLSHFQGYTHRIRVHKLLDNLVVLFKEFSMVHRCCIWEVIARSVASSFSEPRKLSLEIFLWYRMSTLLLLCISQQAGLVEEMLHLFAKMRY